MVDPSQSRILARPWNSCDQLEQALHLCLPTAPAKYPANRLAMGLLALVLIAALPVTPAGALVRFDFEQKYYQHPGRQVWDFSIIRPDSIYHIFYHTIAEATPNAAFADTIWQATSRDLKHWDTPVPILTVGQGPWDEGAIWAPDVFRDEANNRWGLAYTGCDAAMNQSICLAFSPDLVNWTKADANPVVQADSTTYVWDKSSGWADFRDPYIYRQDDQWHILVTAKQDLSGNKGVVYHGTSPDLAVWTDVGPLFVNDGETPYKVLESSQFRTIGSTSYLWFGEFDTAGVTMLAAAQPGDWTMANRTLLDYGYAPEIDEFDPGIHIYSRLAPFSRPSGPSDLSYVVRLDTLLTDPDGSNARVLLAHPLDDNWPVHSGSMNLASPTFGDNPLWRDEPSVGLVGNSYFSSQEYYRGPLSGKGSPGTKIGDAFTGVCESSSFPVTGNRMTLLVGGGVYPATCYVALVDDETGDVLYSETGTGSNPMTPREWDLRPYLGRVCHVTIVDQETGPMGYINVDEIVEHADPEVSGGITTPVRPLRARAWPNPFNPRTTISFEAGRTGSCEVRVHDLRGHLVWTSGPFTAHAGTNSVVWSGMDRNGSPAGAGTYLYVISLEGAVRASAKISLVK